MNLLSKILLDAGLHGSESRLATVHGQALKAIDPGFVGGLETCRVSAEVIGVVG